MSKRLVAALADPWARSFVGLSFAGQSFVGLSFAGTSGAQARQSPEGLDQGASGVHGASDKPKPNTQVHEVVGDDAVHVNVVRLVSPPPTDLAPSTAYWRGASGRLYRTTTHTTVFCPAPQRGIYVLAQRDEAGSVVALFAGVAASHAGTLNLAHIRRRAVRIGASEVHLCPVVGSGSPFSLRRIARDLRHAIPTLPRPGA